MTPISATGSPLWEACDGMVLGRRTYEAVSPNWPPLAGVHPWASRLNEIEKFVFSLTLEVAEWNNTTIVRGDAVTEMAKLKEQPGRDLFTWGHGAFAESLFRNNLVDVLDVNIHPVIVGDGKSFARPGLSAGIRLVSAKVFTKGIVKLSYERA
jgi:dihydrofolate reductase